MVEIIPKPIKKASLGINVLLYFSIILLVAAAGVYFYLGSTIEKNQKILKEKQEILTQPRSNEERKLEEKIFGDKKKIEDFAFLIDQHQISSNFFPFLEGLIHPQVAIFGLSLNVRNAKVELSGMAEKTALGQQLLIFQGNEQILETKLSSLQAREGETVHFSISLSFDREIFKGF